MKWRALIVSIALLALFMSPSIGAEVIDDRDNVGPTGPPGPAAVCPHCSGAAAAQQQMQPGVVMYPPPFPYFARAVVQTPYGPAVVMHGYGPGVPSPSGYRTPWRTYWLGPRPYPTPLRAFWFGIR